MVWLQGYRRIVADVSRANYCSLPAALPTLMIPLPLQAKSPPPRSPVPISPAPCWSLIICISRIIWLSWTLHHPLGCSISLTYTMHMENSTQIRISWPPLWKKIHFIPTFGDLLSWPHLGFSLSRTVKAVISKFKGHILAAAAKSLQLCPTLCDTIDSSPPGSPVPGILQARTLEWVAICFSKVWKWKVKVKSLSRVWLFLATPPPPMGFSRQEYWSGVPLHILASLVLLSH